MGAGRYRDISRTVLGAYSEVPLDFDLDNIVTAKYITQKYSYQATSAHRFVVFSLWERLRGKCQDGLPKILGSA